MRLSSAAGGRETAATAGYRGCGWDDFGGLCAQIELIEIEPVEDVPARLVRSRCDGSDGSAAVEDDYG